MIKANLYKTIYRKQFIWFTIPGYYRWHYSKNHWFKILDEDKNKYPLVKYFDENDLIKL